MNIDTSILWFIIYLYPHVYIYIYTHIHTGSLFQNSSVLSSQALAPEEMREFLTDLDDTAEGGIATSLEHLGVSRVMGVPPNGWFIMDYMGLY